MKEEEDNCFVFLGVSLVSCIVHGGTTTITAGTLHRKIFYGDIKKKKMQRGRVTETESKVKVSSSKVYHISRL